MGIQKTWITTPKGFQAFLSHAPYNIALHTKEECKDSIKNRKNLIKPFKIPQLAYLHQIHSDKILYATQGGLLGDGDGLILTHKGIIGLVMVADCNPILLFDCKQNILMLLHAGRVGLQKGILSNALMQLLKTFNTKTRDIFAYIGPSIRSCCYVVKEEIFQNATHFPHSLEIGKKVQPHKITLDLIAIIKAQLQTFAIQNYTISPLCTCCDSSFFSYRRDKNCGRFGLFAYLV